MSIVRVLKVALGVVLVIAGGLWALFFGAFLLIALSLGVDETWTSVGATVLVVGAMLLGAGAAILGVRLVRAPRVTAEVHKASHSAGTNTR